MSVSRAFDISAERLVSWMREDALPLWSTAACDPRGGFYEDLDMSGAPRPDRIRRVRVQPRQAYVYAHAAALGWCPDGRELSDHGYDYLLTKAADEMPKGTDAFSGFAHRLNPDGSTADPLRDTYDHAFVLLASAWRIAAFEDEWSRTVLAATVDFLDRTCGQADGSFLEGSPRSLPRRQNPHMHLFESFIALGVRAGIPGALERACRIFDLFRTHFFDESEGVLREFYQDDWSLDKDTGHLVEPGHMMEWCSLLDQYEAATGTDVSSYIEVLYTRAEELGLHSNNGLLVDTVSLDPTRPVAATQRTWVQTEYLNATLARARRGDPGMAGKAADIIDRLFSAYLSTDVCGGYIDQLDAEGTIISDAMPTSTLYHLMGVSAETFRTAELLR